MFKHILVPLDESILAECALPHAVALAELTAARVTLLRVLDANGIFGDSHPTDPIEWLLSKAGASRYLEGIKRRLQKKDLRVETVLLEGEPAERIVDFIRNQDVDLVILSSHGQGGLSACSLGSVGQKITFRANVAVMVVRAYQACAKESKYHMLLVPLDGSLRAECALAPAVALARRHEATLLLAHVVTKPEMPRRTPLGPTELELSERLTQLNRQEATSYLEWLKDKLSAEGLKVETHLLTSDDPEASLHALVDQEAVDLVILSAHGYSGSTRWPFGSTVVNFIAYGSTPLLVVQDVMPQEIMPGRVELELAARQYPGH